ncbi:MAG: restriction endonuclease subunit S, partial [[Pasteurella] mairii]|nr:restriction endonuclease subunit S [[Pasteurella] mairii]
WEQRKLGDLGYTFTGLSGKTKNDFGHGKAKFITYLNVFNNPISNVNELEQIEIDIKQNSVQYGDILFTTSSETPNEVGMSSVWLDKTENIYLNSFCFGYRLNVKIDPFFLAFLLRSPSIRKKFILLAQGISRYNISRNKVMEMGICLPRLEEQTAIGNFFKQLDDTIALHQRKHQKMSCVRRENERLF